VDGAPHSLKRLHGGGLGGGAPSLGTLDDMLRKSPDTGISVGGPFQSRGTCCTGGGAHIPGSLIDERKRALAVGHLSAKDSIRGTLGEGSFTEEPVR